MENKFKISLFFVAIICLFTSSVFAQFTRDDAINLVLNTILIDDIGEVDVYASYNSLSGDVELIDNETIDCTYTGNWVFFVDDKPFSGWYHDCRFIFVSADNGDYSIENSNIYPKNQSAIYELINEADRNEPADLGEGTGTMNEGISPNDHYFAVIVCLIDNQRNWNDVSLIFNTLIDIYGYKKENIFVHYDKYGTSSTPNEGDLDNDGYNDLDYSAFSSEVHATFNELAGNTTQNEDIPALEDDDQLAVFFTNAIVTVPIPELILWCFWRDSNGWPYAQIEDPADIASIVADIDCAQITLNFSINSGGGIAEFFMDYNSYTVKCENRYVHAASSLLEDKHYEQYISGGNYGEYFYYWSAAARGVYPVTDQPWAPSQYETGSFPFEIISGFGDHPDDYNPDLDNDGYVQMEEAFLYANDQDTWSVEGYFNPYTSGESEVPVNWYLLPFEEDLLTLAGIAGHVENTQTVESRSYLIGGNLDIDQTVNLTFENGTNLYLGNEIAQITVSPNASMILEDNLEIIGSSFDNKIEVNGLLEVGQNITFTDVNNILLNNENLQTTFNNSTLIRSALINKGMELNVINSDFDDCDVLWSVNSNICITGTNFYCTWLLLENMFGASSNVANISNNYIIGDQDCTSGIFISDYDMFFFENNSIEECGIQIWESGNGATGNQSILDNEIFNCNNKGIMIYNSTASIAGNYIHNNTYGVWLANNSNIALYGNPGATTYAESQQITDNDSYEVFASKNSFPWYFRNNVIIDEDNAGNPNDPMVFHNYPFSIYRDVRYNCWGVEFRPDDDLYPVNGYDYFPEWCPHGDKDTPVPGSDEAIYTNAKDLFEDEFYTQAKDSFQLLINRYPESHYSQAAMKDLFSLEKFENNDYENLRDYFRTNDSIVADSSLEKLGDFLANKCDVKLENWQTAIYWYEDVIQNPETMEDSIFAIIDLGHLYLIMDTTGNKFVIIGQMTEHIPKSKPEFRKKCNYLLSLLPGNNKNNSTDKKLELLNAGELSHNVPNPFSNTTTIYYKLSEQAKVSIKIFNHLGNEIKSISSSEGKEGINKLELNMSNIPSGIYFYSLIVNGKLSDTKKMVIVK